MSQQEIQFARANRDSGIERSEAHANDIYSRWSDHAYELLKWFVQRTPGRFQAEDFRAEIKGLLPEPPTNRAFGGTFRRAANAGLIVKVGTESVTNPNANCAFASVWQRTKILNP